MVARMNNATYLKESTTDIQSLGLLFGRDADNWHVGRFRKMGVKMDLTKDHPNDVDPDHGAVFRAEVADLNDTNS
jgi:hypothetical protein